MMMAFDSSLNPPSRLDESTLQSVRAAIRDYLANGSDGDGLRVALSSLSAEAREKEFLPEQVLVVLKDLWGSLPEVRAMTDHGEQTRMLQRVVTLCIKEYFSA